MPRSRRPWGLGDVALGLGVGIALSVVVGLGFAVAALAPAIRAGDEQAANDALNRLTTSGPYLLAGIAALAVGFVGAPLWATWRKGARSLAVDFGLRFARRDLVIGPLVGLGFIGVSFALSELLTALGLPNGDNSGQITGTHGTGWLIAVAAAGALVAPFTEELFFRGLMLRAVAKRLERYPRAQGWVAGIASTVVFGALHGTGLNAGALSTIGQTAALGAALAFMAWRTQRLGMGIAAHMTNNAVSVVLALALT